MSEGIRSLEIRSNQYKRKADGRLCELSNKAPETASKYLTD